MKKHKKARKKSRTLPPRSSDRATGKTAEETAEITARIVSEITEEITAGISANMDAELTAGEMHPAEPSPAMDVNPSAMFSGPAGEDDKRSLPLEGNGAATEEADAATEEADAATEEADAATEEAGATEEEAGAAEESPAATEADIGAGPIEPELISSGAADRKNIERGNDMITRSDVESFKVISPLMLDLFPQGAVAAVIADNHFEWVANSRNFSTEVFKKGESIAAGGVAARAMQQQTVLTDKLPASAYGVRLVVTAAPVIDDGFVSGAVVIAVPRINPLEMAFRDFAPILSQVFPDGCFVYLTDLEAFTHRYGDQKFDLPSISIGTKFNEGGVAYYSIRQKQAIVKEIDATAYGEECLVGNFPLFDEDDPDEVVGTFGIATPKRTAMNLRNMSNNMHDGMGQIASAIEELAASAFEINSSEQKLHANVQEIAQLSEDINEILGFIKQIAEETKMLGLNAAIEAARAGEAGRGFGVVAEEIRKLSDESKETVTRIRGLTDEIKAKIEDTRRSSSATLHASEEQAAATEEVTAQVQEMNALAEELQKIALSV